MSISMNEEVYDYLMSHGMRAEADAYAEAHGEDEENFDSPMTCAYCENTFDSAVHFITKPYRAVCPECGETQPTERDYDEWED